MVFIGQMGARPERHQGNSRNSKGGQVVDFFTKIVDCLLLTVRHLIVRFVRLLLSPWDAINDVYGEQESEEEQLESLSEMLEEQYGVKVMKVKTPEEAQAKLKEMEENRKK